MLAQPNLLIPSQPSQCPDANRVATRSLPASLLTLLLSSGSEPDWDGSAAAAGLPGANYVGFSVYGPDLSGVYVGINPHNTPVEAALPAAPVRFLPLLFGWLAGNRP